MFIKEKENILILPCKSKICNFQNWILVTRGKKEILFQEWYVLQVG